MTFTDAEYKTYLKVKHALLLESARDYTREYLEEADEKCIDCDDITENEFDAIDFESMVSDFEMQEYYSDEREKWYEIIESYLN